MKIIILNKSMKLDAKLVAEAMTADLVLSVHETSVFVAKNRYGEHGQTLPVNQVAELQFEENR